MERSLKKILGIITSNKRRFSLGKKMISNVSYV